MPKYLIFSLLMIVMGIWYHCLGGHAQGTTWIVGSILLSQLGGKDT